MSKISLTDMRYMVALAKHRHFTQAANECNVTQPTLSVAMNKLESRLGVQIFERSNTELRITEIGERMIAQAATTLAAAKQVEVIAQSGQCQLEETLRIGAIYSVAPYLFPKLIPELQKLAPNMPLIIQENFTHQLINQLQQGELDIVILSLPFAQSGIVSKRIYHEDLVCVLNSNNRLAQQAAIHSEDLTRESILLLGEAHCLRDQIIGACPQCYQPHALQHMLEGSSLETLRHMVAAGMGITILPKPAADMSYSNQNLVVKPFADIKPQREIAIAWRVSFPRPKVIDALTQALHSSFPQNVDHVK